MNPEEGKILIEGTYTDGRTSRWGPRLILKGPLDRATIDEVIHPYRPLTFSPNSDGYEGGASFLVSDESAAKKLVNTLDAKLRTHGFEIAYDPKQNYTS